MNSWIKGLKEYNKGSDSWCIPKKGSKGYNEIMNKTKPPTSKEIQEMRKKSEKFAKEDTKNTRNEIKKIMGVGRYASRSKEPSTSDYIKEQKEHEEMMKRYYKRGKTGKKLVVIL
jgi:molecular chaperone DnaK (HSP70)